MARDLFKRYIWLVDTIYQARKIDFEGINDKWKRSSLSEGNCLPKKTFQNHRKAIEDIFDVLIECDTQNGYKYYIDSAEDFNDNSMRHWLLSTFTVNNLISESQKIKDRIHLENTPSGQKYLSPIIEAMRDGYCIELTYQSYWRDSLNTILIEPYFVKIFKQRWYVIANNRVKQSTRVYALDRIKDLNILSVKFELPETFKPVDYFYDCYGIIRDDGIEECRVKVKMTASQARYLRDLPLHHSQEELESDNKMSIFAYYIKPSFDFKKELLSMGAEVEVVEPEWFREEIMREIENMNNKYK